MNSTQSLISRYFSNWEQLSIELCSYAQHEFIFQMGEPVSSLYFLTAGSVLVSAPAIDGNATFITELHTDAVIGDIEYLMNIPAVSTVQALTSVSCIRIPIFQNRHLIEHDLTFYRYLCRTLATRFTDTNMRTIQKTQLTLDKRLAEYLLTQYSLTEAITNLKPVSELLRCSYRQLLRVIKVFCEKKYLRKDDRRGVYYLNDTAGLRKLL